MLNCPQLGNLLAFRRLGTSHPVSLATKQGTLDIRVPIDSLVPACLSVRLLNHFNRQRPFLFSLVPLCLFTFLPLYHLSEEDRTVNLGAFFFELGGDLAPRAFTFLFLRNRLNRLDSAINRVLKKPSATRFISSKSRFKKGIGANRLRLG